MKQIGLAVGMYTQDYDEYLPFAWSMQGGWYNVLNPYIKNGVNTAITWNAVGTKGVWHCPDDPNAGMSYSANALTFGGGAQAWTLYPALSLAAIDKPASVVAVGEVVAWYDKNGNYVDVPTDYVRPGADLPSITDPTSDAAVAWYKTWLSYDETDKKPGSTSNDCDAAVQITGHPCKAIAYRHTRSGNNSGLANFCFVDGHAKAMRFGSMKVSNWFPSLTPSQQATYDN